MMHPPSNGAARLGSYSTEADVAEELHLLGRLDT